MKSNPLTDTEIESLVAERVLGWTEIHEENISRTQSDGTQCHALCGRSPGGVHSHDFLPRPLSDANDDMDVKKKVTETWNNTQQAAFWDAITTLRLTRLDVDLIHSTEKFGETGDYARAAADVLITEDRTDDQ